MHCNGSVRAVSGDENACCCVALSAALVLFGQTGGPVRWKIGSVACIGVIVVLGWKDMTEWSLKGEEGADCNDCNGLC